MNSIKYYQKINRIHLSKVFLILNVLCFLCVSLIFFIIKTNYYLYYILNVDSLFIVECNLSTFYLHN